MKEDSPYRFVICTLSTATVFVCVGLVSNAFSIYLPFIIKVHGFTNTQISLMAAVRSVASLAAMFAVDYYYAKLGLKKGIALALFCAPAAFLIYGFSSTPVLYYLASAIAGFSYALGGMVPASLLIRQWFPLKPAAALGIAASGSGLGAIIGPVALMFLINHFGLSSSFLIEALAIAVFAIPVIILIRENPAFSTHGRPAGPGGTETSFAVKRSGRTSDRDSKMLLHDRLNPREHFFIMAGIFLIGVVGLTGYNNLSLLYMTTGHSAAMVSFFLSLMGALLIIGKCSFGWIADRIGSYPAAALFCLLLCIGQTLCCFAPQAGSLLFGITFLFLGVGLALASVGLSLMASDFCRKGNFATVLKNYQLAYTLGGLMSSAVPGILADKTGSYLPSYILFFIFSIAIFLFIVPVYRHHGGTLPHRPLKTA